LERHERREDVLQDITLSFIGSGMMAEAMIVGLLNQKLIEPTQIIAADPLQDRCETLVARYGIRTTTDNEEAAESGQIVVLSVKPQVLGDVIPQVRGHLRRQDLGLSIVAGAPLRTLADGTAHAAFVRAMPNTPGQIGQGITVWTSTPEVSGPFLEQARAILGALGEEVYVADESYLDMATALSGTGPAYVFLFMEAMIDAGVHLGFSRRIATQLVLQTMQGSVAYARQTDRHVAELRNQVTSPGGTSAEALYHLERGGLRTVISRAIWAAYQRSVALGRGNKRDELPENKE
jgi:pyrroline-5-carboxylate reductase